MCAKEGNDINTIRQKILETCEARVRQNYLDLLKREPEPKKLDWWVGKCKNGESDAKREAFMKSTSEYKQKNS